MRKNVLSNLEKDFPGHTFGFVKAKKGGVLLKIDGEVAHIRMNSESQSLLWKELVGASISAKWDPEDDPDEWLEDDSPGPLPEEEVADKTDQILYDAIIKDEVKRIFGISDYTAKYRDSDT